MSFVPTPVPLLVALEAGSTHTPARLRPFTTLGKGSYVPVVWMEAIIDVATEFIVPAEPRPGADKHCSAEPLRTIVPGRCTPIGSCIEITMRAFRCDNHTYG